jgi:16S rRNA (cytosine967-C5)-methyltransferase
MNSRAIAAQILAKVFRQHGNLDDGLASVADDKAFIQELCFGVCRYYFSLSHIANQLLKKPFQRKDSDILALVLVGLYQIIYLEKEAFAAVNECVTAAKQLNKKWAAGLINGVLRNFLRNTETFLASIEKDPRARYNCPKWLLDKVKQAYPEQWETILTANNTKAPMTLRVNQQEISRADYLTLLNTHGIEAQATQFSTDGITLNKPTNLTKLPGFSNGEISVQDEAAQLAAGLLDIQPKQIILDACAAPGGKTCHILECQPNNEVIALDNNAKRNERVTENLQRLELNATVITADAAETKQWAQGKSFDRILLDAPCSATGVIRRHPDIKLLRRPTDIKTLTETQLHLLQALWPLLSPGGILLYATCSILPDENDKLIQQFNDQQSNCEIMPIKATWGIATKCGRQLLPEPNDGFYYSRLVKTAP